MMKKITLLFVFALFTSITAFSQQVLLEESMMDGAVPAGWLNLDIDGLTGDEFFTGNNLFSITEFTPVNFNGPGAAIYSLAEFDTASTPATANDWLISPQITLLSNPSLEFEFNSLAAGMTAQVLVATTLAGATPAPGDFTALNTYSLSGNQTWTTFNEDLTALYANQMVYIAFRHTSADPLDNNQVKLLGIRNVSVLQTNPDDIKLSSVMVNGTNDYETDYLQVNFPYSNFSCTGPSATTVTIEVENVGVNPITTFDAYYIVDSFGTGVPNMETVTLGAPLAAGASDSYTFITTADLSGGDPFYGIVSWVVFAGDISPLDDTTSLDFIFTPTTYDFAVNGDFTEDFEQVDFGAGQLSLASTSWLWTIVDNNGDGNTLSISAGNAGNPNGGDFTLGYLYNTNGTTAANDYAFSPCMELQAGVGYQVSAFAACGNDNGTIYPERFRFVYNSTATVTGNTGIASFDIDSDVYSEVTSSFIVPTTGTYHLGIHVNSDADQWYLNIDDLNITTFTTTPVSDFTVTDFDQIIGGVYTKFCDGDVTINNTSTGVIDETTVDWGDGNTETFTGTSLSHTYAAQGTYTISVTASNILGGTATTETFEYAAPPAPTADFTIGQSGITDNSVDFNSIGGLPCYTYDWIFGDGTLGTGAAASHTYTANGTFTVFLEVKSPTGQSSIISKEVTISGIGIETIEFVNGINVSPNPATDKLNVSFELNSNQNVEINLVSIDGKIVSAISSSNVSNVNTTINTSNLSKGMYILNVTTTEGKYTRNVIVK